MELESTINPIEKCRWHNASFLSRSEHVVDIGHSVLGHTALTNGKAVAELDNQAIDEFFDVLAPNPQAYPQLANWKEKGGLVEHCHFSGEIAYRLTVAINERLGLDINPHAQKAALKLHDLGRTAVHSFMETDELTDIFWQQIGLREDLKKMTHSAHLYWSDQSELDYDQIPVSVRISIVSDVFGKRSQANPERLRHKEEVLEAVKAGKQKYLHKKDPTVYEEELVRRLPTYTQKEQYAISKTLEWLEGLDIDVNQIVDEVMAENKKGKLRS